MATLTRKKTRLSWHQVLQAVQEMSPQEQRRLRAELEKSAGVYLVRPPGADAAWQKPFELNWPLQPVILWTRP